MNPRTFKIIELVVYHAVLLYLNFGLFYSIVACIHVCQHESIFGRAAIFLATFAAWPWHILTQKLFY